jgi:AcrR family transcriptional regulator
VENRSPLKVTQVETLSPLSKIKIVEVPLRADAERNRQRLLVAAKELFATRGLHVTLDDIARHAGVGTGTAYRRFPNKDALIEALMVDRIHEIGAIARESLEDPDPWRALAGFFERALALQATDRGLKDILWSSGHGKEQVVHARRAIAPPVNRLVARAVEAGVVRADMATSDVPVINYMLNFLIDFSRDVEPELYKRYLAIVLDGLKPRDDLGPLPVDALSVRAFQDIVAKS